MSDEVKKVKRTLRPQFLGEEIGNAITHGIGFIMGVIGTIFLLIKSDTAAEYVGSAIFGFGMMMLYIMSCFYHAFKNGSTVKNVFKRFDHLSIYLLIGGTFAPILLCAASQPKGLIFFIIQWCIIAFGVVLKSINTKKYHVLHVVLYLLLGWSGLIFMPDLMALSTNLFMLILLGGIIYSLGVAFYAAQFKYAHFIWHFFCIAGTMVHFFAIYTYLL